MAGVPSDPAKISLALIFGGRSSEHEISCVTAGAVLGAIDRSRFSVIPIGITKTGRFVLQPDDAEALALNPAAMPTVGKGPEVLPPEDSESRMFRIVSDDGVLRDLAEIDVVFPLLHGPWGEDGTLQGMLELLSVPYVGSGVLASAAGMDKVFTKTVLAAEGIPVCPYVATTVDEWEHDPAAVRARVGELGLPVFVKPARAGSSVGVSRVTHDDELAAALAVAFAEDVKVLVEQQVVGREVEIGVIEGRAASAPRTSVAGEITVVGHDFYDYESKYLDEGAATITVPARLSDAQLDEMRDLAAHAFTALGCAGLARVDFFLTDSGFIVNEVNTMPGFTPLSMFPQVWLASGFSYPELVSELIELARQR